MEVLFNRHDAFEWRVVVLLRVPDSQWLVDANRSQQTLGKGKTAYLNHLRRPRLGYLAQPAPPAHRFTQQ
jgi:hypothetical protein